MIWEQEGKFSIISYIDCPKCKAVKSIEIDKCTIPGYRCTDRMPCKVCGYGV